MIKSSSGRIRRGFIERYTQSRTVKMCPECCMISIKQTHRTYRFFWLYRRCASAVKNGFCMTSFPFCPSAMPQGGKAVYFSAPPLMCFPHVHWLTKGEKTKNVAILVTHGDTDALITMWLDYWHAHYMNCPWKQLKNYHWSRMQQEDLLDANLTQHITHLLKDLYYPPCGFF